MKLDDRAERQQVPLRLFQTAFVILIGVLFLALWYLVASSRNTPLDVYLRDPAATYAFTPLAGLISHIGVFAVSAAGVICIFASFHLSRGRSLLVLAGAFNLLIAMDDFFMLHEEILPRALGVAESLVLLAYGAIAGVIFLIFRSSLTGRAHLGLCAAAALLAASVLADNVMPYSMEQVIVEDGLKFLGLMVWSVYWTRRAHLALRGAARASA
ncbi:MAG: hypothetical protein FJX25_07850 [Alphaproteobacteria bacterium]|nr:hypothetical protein [Alphaproteobacteria bacterium]